MKTKIIVISISLIIICAATIGILSEKQQTGLAETIDEHSIHSVQGERQWAENILEPLQLHSDIRDSLFSPEILRSVGRYLYVGDYGDMKIKRFTPEGNYVNEIGIGRGKGPGEFTQFMDFYVSGDTIYVLDLRKWMVIQFNVNTNSHIRSFKIDFNPLRILGIRDKLIILSLGGTELFKVYDRSGEKLNQFGELMENQLSNPLSLQGELISTSRKSEFIFVPSFASYLFYYNFEGKINRVVKTFGQKGIPVSPHKSSGGVKIIANPEANMKVMGFAKDKGLLYLLYLKKKDQVPKDGESNFEAFIDVYHLKTGGYMHSIALPFPVRRMAVRDKRLYLIRTKDTRVVAFNIKSRE